MLRWAGHLIRIQDPATAKKVMQYNLCLIRGFKPGNIRRSDYNVLRKVRKGN